MKRHIIRQPRIAGVQRVQKSAGLLPELEQALIREANRFGVSVPFVTATLLAAILKVEDQPNYKTVASKLRAVPKRRTG